MAKRTCSIDGCTRVHNARGLCITHYSRWAKYGSTELPEIPSLPDRFATLIERTDTCWLWTGPVAKKVHVMHNRRSIYVGCFTSLEAAEVAAIAGRNELFTHNDADRVGA